MVKKRGYTTLPHGRVGRRRRRNRIPRYLVVCGGEVTEPEYFKHYNRLLRRSAVIEVKVKRGDPSQIARYAERLKNIDAKKSDEDSYKAVWVVVDVDGFIQHADAQKICNKNGISLIISNPCFEVWLLDHAQCCPESCATTRDVERRVAKMGLTYGNRNKYINFTAVEGFEVQAINNAHRHNTAGKRRERMLLAYGHESGYAPWTDMDEVAEELGLDNIA